MKTFSVYIKKENKTNLEDSIFVEDGFSWKAGLFNLFWFLYHKMWFASFLAFTFLMLVNSLVEKSIINHLIYILVYLLFIILSAIFATTWYCSFLIAKNYYLEDIIIEKDIELARLKYFQKNLPSYNKSGYN